jgi:hypothetical protein
MQAYAKKGLTIRFTCRESTSTYRTSKHDHAPRLLSVTKGHNLTGLTPVAKTDRGSKVLSL